MSDIQYELKDMINFGKSLQYQNELNFEDQLRFDSDETFLDDKTPSTRENV